MKYFLIVALAAAIINGWSLFTAVNAEKDIAEDITSLINKTIIECSKEHNISKDAIKDIMTHVSVSEDQEVKAEKDIAEDITSLINKTIIECSKEHNISKDATRDIMTHVRVSEDQEVKCWLHCIMKTIGMIKDGGLDWEYCKTISKIGLSDADKAKVDEIAEICQAEVTGDEKDQCQLAYKIAVCKIKNWNKLGLPKGTWEE